MADAMKVYAMKVYAMKISAVRHLSALALGVAIGAMTVSTVWAQGLGGGQGLATGRRNVPNEKPPPAAAAAIPGATPREPAAPPTRPATEMQPTEALFDAINRGDIAAARDSLNRGADLNGVNVLGMTPMELSVDLGRNDISFLLLSMRGEDSSRGSRASGRDTPAPAAPVAKTVQATKAPAKGAQAANAPVAAKPPVATPKLFANDGGTPLPNAGFLGFGPRAASN
jgi:hypothetical protein